MQNLRKLDIQLCHSAFADVLFANNPEKLITNEDFVFAPLVGIGINRTSLEKFEVEVDWPAGDEGWDDMDTPFTLTRVDPRMRRW
jgi:hypothetical protein